MLQRILTGWNFQRALYLAMGLVIIAQGIISKEWIGIVLGCYFSAMGIFKFGCASGACFGVNSKPNSNESNTQEIEFEEVK
jgi:hypothetical protein